MRYGVPDDRQELAPPKIAINRDSIFALFDDSPHIFPPQQKTAAATTFGSIVFLNGVGSVEDVMRGLVLFGQ